MKTIKIDKATAERWLQSEVQELKDLALQTYPELGKKELPKTWEEYCVIKNYNIYHPLYPTKEIEDASHCFNKLAHLREVYRDGWKPDWTDGYQGKYCIDFFKNKIETDVYTGLGSFLSFQSEEIRDLFLENFRELIEKAKPLMS